MCELLHRSGEIGLGARAQIDAEGGCELTAILAKRSHTVERKIDPLTAKRKNPFLLRQLHKNHRWGETT